MYHYTYLITNKINNKTYYGVRSCKCLTEDDIKYMGSGTAMKSAIKKYGIENFTKEVDEVFESREEANLYEAKIVNINWVKDRNNYNLALGGGIYSSQLKSKDSPYYNIPRTNEVKVKISNSRKGIKVSQEVKNKISQSLMGRFKGHKNPFYGKTHSDEVKEKLAEYSSKNWLIINPDGDSFEIYNLEKFCRENNLHARHMGAVAQGKEKTYKGWKCKKL